MTDYISKIHIVVSCLTLYFVYSTYSNMNSYFNKSGKPVLRGVTDQSTTTLKDIRAEAIPKPSGSGVSVSSTDITKQLQDIKSNIKMLRAEIDQVKNMINSLSIKMDTRSGSVPASAPQYNPGNLATPLYPNPMLPHY